VISESSKNNPPNAGQILNDIMDCQLPQVSWFQNLFDARRKIAVWQKDYNEARPHSSLGYLTPHEYAAEKSKASCGKDAGQKAASLENAKSRVSHFPTAPAATGILETIQGPNVV